jgi:hypothetical protein
MMSCQRRSSKVVPLTGGPDAITLKRSGFGTVPAIGIYPYAPRTYWLNHSMVRVQACWADAWL